MSVIDMNDFGIWLAWLSQGLAWITIAWFVIALLIGVPWIITDEVRFKRTAPKPVEIIVHADKLEAEHGTEAMTVVGQAMYEAAVRQDFASRRVLKAVSAELAQRTIGRERL